MRKIKKVHQAIDSPMGDLKTYRALPTASVNHIDPFLFLNHHGPQFFEANNQGLPFGSHPHRGFITLTFIVDGDIVHKDSGGGTSKITAGGVQWMTAGRGLVHSEVSSEEFKMKGGQLEILQLWVNLPARLKMTDPYYEGMPYEDIVHFNLDDDLVKVNLICGEWNAQKGNFDAPFPLFMSSIEIQKGGKFSRSIPATENIFLYVVKGQLEINNQLVDQLCLVEFENQNEEIQITATEESLLILGSAPPNKEPIVAYGPFVMNSEKEIRQAYKDFQEGKFS